MVVVAGVVMFAAAEMEWPVFTCTTTTALRYTWIRIIYSFILVDMFESESRKKYPNRILWSSFLLFLLLLLLLILIIILLPQCNWDCCARCAARYSHVAPEDDQRFWHPSEPGGVTTDHADPTRVLSFQETSYIMKILTPYLLSSSPFSIKICSCKHFLCKSSYFFFEFLLWCVFVGSVRIHFLSMRPKQIGTTLRSKQKTEVQFFLDG